ncbi:DUF3939 domain-containing protein [Texcoconibacillus texcoconensis]|uniref:DUF3939 domain-containing protein n=1 Tax=Texcoconibacillus texcoconensis TaxID=1095777 RepID=A0A840QUM5_9BACI|nr:DUF3939 domain-containing protein [Texcoconibacillus texcoconensis]MBB5175064.1 hypothetical protein [Texcoconibacillus texcoconensis]
MLFGKRRKAKEKAEDHVVDVSLSEVRSAVNTYADSLQPGISLRSLVNEKGEIDGKRLAPILGGVPARPFYMSKETFEIFEDPKYVEWIDDVQVACDQYLKAHGEYPIMNNKDREISYHKLRHFLKEQPDIPLYLHPKDKMITHRHPSDY